MLLMAAGSGVSRLPHGQRGTRHMPLVLRGAAIMAAFMTAALLAGAAARAAPVTYQITGTCDLACNAGTRLAGSMILDQDQPASTVILSSQFTDLRYSVDGGASITPSLRWATGEWGGTPGSVQNLEFNAGSTVLPDPRTIDAGRAQRQRRRQAHRHLHLHRQRRLHHQRLQRGAILDLSDQFQRHRHAARLRAVAGPAAVQPRAGARQHRRPRQHRRLAAERARPA